MPFSSIYYVFPDIQGKAISYNTSIKITPMKKLKSVFKLEDLWSYKDNLTLLCVGCNPSKFMLLNIKWSVNRHTNIMVFYNFLNYGKTQFQTVTKGLFEHYRMFRGKQCKNMYKDKL